MPDWAQWVTFAIALVGAALGVLSTWRSLTRDTPRLKVRTLWYGVRIEPGRTVEITTRSSEALEKFPSGALGIEVINTGLVPVYVGQVGFCASRVKWLHRFREFNDPAGKAVVIGDANNVVDLPKKLEPGDRFNIRCAKDWPKSTRMKTASAVYAMTQDERVFTGTSELLREVVKRARIDGV